MIKKRNIVKNFPCVAITIGVAMATLVRVEAQENVPPVIELDEETTLETVVILGNRIPQQISQTARTVYTVEAQEIVSLTRAGKSLQQILGETIPSFDPASDAARTSYGQNLRGRTALILIDGVSMNSARTLSRQFDSIDPFNIERVEVLSGASAIYGGNATGGIINIITKRGRDALEGTHLEVMTSLGSGFAGRRDFDRSASGALTYNSETWDARLSITGNRHGAFYDGSGVLLVPDITQTSTAFNTHVDIMGAVGFQISDNRRLELSAQYFDSSQNSPYGLYYGPLFAALADPSLFETRDGYSSDFDPKTQRTMFNATYTDDDVFGQKFLFQGSFRSEKINFHPFPGTNPFFYFGGSSQDTDYYSLKAAMIAEPLDGLTITYGVDADRDSFASRQHIFDITRAALSGGMNFKTIGIAGLYPDIDVTTVAGFIQASYDVTDRLTLNGGARYQYAKTEVSDFIGAAQQIAILNGLALSADTIPGGNISYDAAMFNAGVSYSLDDRQKVYANFSQGFELPDPAKYYGLGNYILSGGHLSLLGSINVGSSALQEVKTDSFELGYRFNNGIYGFEIASYYSLSDRVIDINRSTLSIDVVDQDRRVYGIEAKGSAALDHGFDIGLSGHWVKGEIKTSNGWERETIGAASVSKIGGHIGWQNDNLNLRLSGQHVFSLKDADGHMIDDYTLFDLTGAYHFNQIDTTLRFGILNLFDKDYTTSWGARAKALYGALADEAVFDYKGRGRTFSLSLTKEF